MLAEGWYYQCGMGELDGLYEIGNILSELAQWRVGSQDAYHSIYNMNSVKNFFYVNLSFAVCITIDFLLLIFWTRLKV